ncbi:MAG: ComEC/Rec2 family competence protein [Lentimicrobiaceae bacterium]|nr:ComEC/Rec2 family competence protein [Lentimicrobiaceae bacterium]
MNLSRYTLVRLAIPFMAGITAGRYHSGMPWIALSLILLAGPLLTAGAWWFKHLFSYRTRWIPGLAAYLVYFSMGWLINSFFLGALDPYHHTLWSPKLEDQVCTLLKIKDKASLKPGRVMVFAEVVAASDGMKTYPLRGRTRISIRTDSADVLRYLPGTYWATAAPGRKPYQSPDNWGFNYAAWLFSKGIHDVWMLDEHDLKAVATDPVSVRRWGVLQQQRLLGKIWQMGLDTAAVGMTGAMLFGDKSTLQPDEGELFRRAGVMHVLCVSGLHTGAVYAGAVFLIGLVVRSRRLKKWVPLLALLPVLAFACITGLAPSVCRATLMLVLHAFGRLARRRPSGINLLAGTALLLLWPNPGLLFDLGFQFSFIAVASILWISQPASAWLGLRGKGLRPAIGGLLLVSLAAQAGTSAISLLHFHTFPSYFLPANLFVVPASTLLIYTGMLSVILESAGICPVILHWVFQNMVLGMEKLVGFWAELPGASMEDIPFSLMDSVVVYLLLLLLSLSLVALRKWQLMLAMFVVIVWNVHGSYQKWTREDMNQFLVWPSDPPGIMVRSGSRVYAIGMGGLNVAADPGLLAWLHAQGLKRADIAVLPSGAPYRHHCFELRQGQGYYTVVTPAGIHALVFSPDIRVDPGGLPEELQHKTILVLSDPRQLRVIKDQKIKGITMVFSPGVRRSFLDRLQKQHPSAKVWDLRKEGCLIL